MKKKRSYVELIGEIIGIMAIIASIVLISMVSFFKQPYEVKTGKGATSINQWKIISDAGEPTATLPIDFRGKRLVVESVLPDVNDAQTLYIKVNFAYLYVYVDGKMVYKVEPAKMGLMSTSVGGYMAFVPMESSYSGKTIRLEIELRGNRVSESLKNIIVTRKSDYVMDRILDNFLEIIMGAVYTIIGVIMLLAYLFFLPSGKHLLELRRRGFLYGAIMMVSIGFWTLSDIHILGIISNNLTASGLLNYLTFYMMSIGAVGFIYYTLPEELTKLRALSYSILRVSQINLVVQTIVYVLGLQDLPSMLMSTQLLAVLAILQLIISSLYIGISGTKDHAWMSWLWTILISVLIILSLVLYAFDKDWGPFFMFTVLFIIGGLVYRLIKMTYVLLRKSIELEEMTTYAFTDSLTGLGNRHAYDEDIQHQEGFSAKDNYIIAMFDVNGLKVANDTLGHTAGDELLQGAAKCLEDAYADIGTCYRMGGDEFIVVAMCDEDLFEQRCQIFEDLTRGWSGKMVKSLSVSFGYASKKRMPDATAVDVEKEADKKMYEAKSLYYQNHDRRR